MKRRFKSSSDAEVFLLILRFLLIMCTAVLANSCAWLIQPPQSDEFARQRTAHWAEHNEALQQFKGLMRIQVQAQGNAMNGRAAWAAAFPGSLRVELLNVIGQPLATLASDGHTISLLSMGDRKFYRFNQSRAALERFIHIPLGIEDLLAILIGRPPLPAYTAAQATEEGRQGVEIMLKNRWNQVVADLQFDAGDHIKSIRIYDAPGALQYTVHWDQWQTVEGYDVPYKVRIESSAGDQVMMTIDRLWPEISLPPAVFVLKPLEE